MVTLSKSQKRVARRQQEKFAAEADKLARAREQGQAQFDSIKEMVEKLQRAEARVAGDLENEIFSPDDVEIDADEARQTIEEDALSVEVRSGWVAPGSWDVVHGRDRTKPEEYCILLCTGGPACRIIGKLDGYGQPETARMEVQDWFTPWAEYRPYYNANEINRDKPVEDVMLAYARVFYFGD